jgi:hypothetical protein
MLGAGGIDYRVQATKGYEWYIETQRIIRLDYASNLTELNGSSSASDDLKLRANETDTDSYLYFDGSAGNIAVNGATLSANYDLALLGDGILCIKESATPTADADHGKIYCKNDNKLYFQDGAGAEHEIAYVP